LMLFWSMKKWFERIEELMWSWPSSFKWHANWRYFGNLSTILRLKSMIIQHLLKKWLFFSLMKSYTFL